MLVSGLNLKNMKSMTINELLERALYSSYRKQWSKALEYARGAIDKEPNNFLAYKRLGLALWYSDKKDEAIDAMKKSIELQPEFASAYYNLACFYAIDNMKTEMLFHLKKSIELDKYTNYREMAENDEDFDRFIEDDDFLEIVKANKKKSKKLHEVFASEDYNAISDAILQIEKEIPLEAIEWDYSPDGDSITDLLEDKADKIKSEALLYLFKIVTINTSIEDFEGFSILMNVLRSKIKEDFDDLIIETWKGRYEYTDSGHLSDIDRQILESLKGLPVERCAEVVLWGLKSHGKDAIQDHEDLCALLLHKLPESHKHRTELVDIIDNYLHGDIYKEEDFKTRQKRIRIALSPPPVEVPSNSNDRWAYEKAAIIHFHPANVVRAASHMAIQKDPEIVELVKQNLPRICGFVTDSSLPVDLRVTSVTGVIERVGDKESVASLGPALLDKSVGLIEAVGRLMYNFNILPEETKFAVDYLSETAKKENIDDYDLYDLIRALLWLKDERVTKVLLSALNNKTEAVRREAIRGLGIQKASSAIPQIVLQLREGSPQCVSAAAEAFDAIGGKALTELTNKNNYELVLKMAKKNPRWAIKALNYFQLEQVHDDLIELFKTTNEREAFRHLAKGIANWCKEESIPQLVLLGLDRYKAESIGARNFIVVFRAIARNHTYPDKQIIEEVKNILSNSPTEDIVAFADDLKSDSRYADIIKPSKAEKESEEKYTKTYMVALKTIRPEAEELARIMFSENSN